MTYKYSSNIVAISCYCKQTYSMASNVISDAAFSLITATRLSVLLLISGIICVNKVLSKGYEFSQELEHNNHH